jgi:hypothetical protein
VNNAKVKVFLINHSVVIHIFCIYIYMYERDVIFLFRSTVRSTVFVANLRDQETPRGFEENVQFFTPKT